jgi:hypothetical protein
MKASKNGYIDIVNTLIEADANVNLQNKYGETALMTAVQEIGNDIQVNSYIEIINTLIAAGANVNLQNKYGYTALFTLTKKSTDVFYGNDLTLVEDYEEHQFLIKYLNKFIKDFEDMLKILLENNANPYVENNKGETIFDIAKGHIQIINSIKKVIKDINRDKKYIAIKAYVQSQRINSYSTESVPPLSGFYHSNIDAPHDIMEQVLSTAYGDYEKENEEEGGAEESKSNRGDAGGNKKGGKSVRKKSVKRKSVKRKSIKRKSVRRKSVKRKSVKRKSIKRKSIKRKSVRKKSVRRKSKCKRRKSPRK